MLLGCTFKNSFLHDTCTTVHAYGSKIAFIAKGRRVAGLSCLGIMLHEHQLTLANCDLVATTTAAPATLVAASLASRVTASPWNLLEPALLDLRTMSYIKSLWFARDRATVFMSSVVLSVLSVLLGAPTIADS